MKYFLLVHILFFIGCSCTHTSKQLDKQSAVENNDLTALMSGCGQQLVNSGYLICRENEGQVSKDEHLIIHTPPDLKCESDHCTYVKVFFPDGKPTLEKSIPSVTPLLRISWSEIVNKPVFDITDRGFYAVSITMKYLGPDGVERQTYAQGMVFMHVVRKEYTSLIENQDDPNFNWTWKTDQNQTIKMTTGYRVFVDLSPEFQSSEMSQQRDPTLNFQIDLW